MDNIEQTVRRRDENEQKKDRFKYNLLLASAAAFSIAALVTFFNIFFIAGDPERSVSAFDIVPFIVTVIITAVCFFKKDDMILEYDYAVEDDHLIVAKIKNLSSRKELLNVPASAFKRIDAYNEANFRTLDAKKYVCTLNADAAKYVLSFDKGERCALLFEPNEELLKMIQRELRR